MEPGPSKRYRMLWAALGIAAIYWLLESLLHTFVFEEGGYLGGLLPDSADELWMRSLIVLLLIGFGVYVDRVLDETRRAHAERAALQEELQQALAHVLSGFVPICGSCKKIREPGGDSDDPKAWSSVEAYIATRSDVRFSHSVCPDCMDRYFGSGDRR